MELLAAVDLLEGGAVRLVRGDFERRTAYGDPLALARRFLVAGARWLHVVDLDAARTGEPVNRATVAAIAAEAAGQGASVEVGGGVRTDADVDELLAAGVTRVVVGTAALDDPAMVARCATRHPGRVALGLDYNRRPDGALEPAVRGWLEGSSATVAALLEDFGLLPIGAVVATAIDRDGTLEGPDGEGLAGILDATALPVVASGGVGSPEDLRALAALRSPGGRRLAGAVVGRALADGRIDVEEAIAACVPSG